MAKSAGGGGVADPTTPYGLPGAQVEPTAGYWTFGPCEVPRVVRIADLLPVTDDPNHAFYFPPFPTDPKVVQAEIDELVDLAGKRDDPAQVASSSATRPRLLLSQLLQLRPAPLSAIFNLARNDPPRTSLMNQCGVVTPPVITTGRELARMFEAETPGLSHRHALNCLLFNRDVSPPRQARIWMALDVAIYSALHAAWYYKWASDRPNVSYRRRPVEFEPALDVLYDVPVRDDGRPPQGDTNDPPPWGCPLPSPGTPRHPAYPSGHSTYSGAASEILSYFFPDMRQEFDRLADNIGLARMWAGIHYRSDHEAGNKLGRAVARFVVCQLEGDLIPEFRPTPPCDNANLPPTPGKQDVRQDAYALRAGCLCEPSGREAIRPPSADSEAQARGPQQGAR